jgi:hypothetical protein
LFVGLRPLSVATNFEQFDLSKLAVGTCVTVDLTHSGITPAHSISLFLRAECRDLIKFLLTPQEKVKMVTGPPGVGKSVEVFLYAYQQSFTRKLIYIHGVNNMLSILVGQNNEFRALANFDPGALPAWPGFNPSWSRLTKMYLW